MYDGCVFGCDKKGVERLTFSYEDGGQTFDDGVIFVCTDCVNSLGREGCINEIRGEWCTPYPRSSQPLDDEEQEALSVKMDVPESIFMKVARILAGSKS
nr:hypothetical protein [uncultured Mediterranean phage uvMED]